MLFDAVHVLRAINVQLSSLFYFRRDLNLQLCDGFRQLLLLFTQLQDVLVVRGHLQRLVAQIVEHHH